MAKVYKEKLHYSVFSNIIYSAKILWQEKKFLLPMAFLGVVVAILVPFAGILTPRIVIDEITSGATPARFMAVIGILGLVLIVLHATRGWIMNTLHEHIFLATETRYNIKSMEKMLSMDYANMEKPHFIRCIGRSNMHGGNNNSSSRFFSIFIDCVRVFGGLLVFGGVIVLVHPLILVLLIAGAAITAVMLAIERRYDKNRWDKGELWRTQQMLGYVSQVYGDKQNAKDLRIYDMIPWFNVRFDQYLKLMQESDAKVSLRRLAGFLVGAVLELVRDGAAYAYLVYLLLADRIGLGEFVMLFAAIASIAGIISNGVHCVNSLIQSSLELSYRRELLNFPDGPVIGEGAPLPPLDKAPEIVLENVSYTYPHFELKAEGELVVYDDQKPSIENINVTIKPGERIAIVGANGAGKTTLIKIICGLYKPTTGRVMVGGRNITEYNRDDYFKMITAVFQDIYLIAESIAENVSQKISSETDAALAAACLEKAGLGDKLQTLTNGADTLLVREVHEDATDLSGGERQKLALARALYKNSPILILDEPTAALDPIAEDEIYQQYAEMTRGKTSIYISHRLASTRFCDRILFMDDKTITEVGTHDELIKLGGNYAEMYSVQASYYAK